MFIVSCEVAVALALGLLLPSAATATPPSRGFAPAAHREGGTLYVTWGGVLDESGIEERTALSAIELATGRVLWSLRGRIALYPPAGVGAGEIPASGGLLFLNGSIEGRWGGVALNVGREGRVAWALDQGWFLAVAEGIAVSSAGRAYRAATGELLWELPEGCTEGVIERGAPGGPRQVYCLRPRSVPGPERCELRLARHDLEDGSPLAPELRLGRCGYSDLTAAGPGRVVIGDASPPYELLTIDLAREENPWLVPCEPYFTAHRPSGTVICQHRNSQTAVAVDLASREAASVRELSLPAGTPMTWVREASDAGAVLGWSIAGRGPVEYRPRGGVTPLAEAGAIEQMRQAWFGAEGRAYLVSGAYELIAMDREKGRILWRTDRGPSQQRGVPWYLWDDGERAGLIFSRGVVLPFDPRTGEIGEHRFAVDSLSTAIAWNDEPEVERLLERGEDPDRVSLWSPASPMRLAVQGGNPRIVARLLAAGADFDEPSQYRLTPLHQAAASGHAEIVRLLLEAGADPRRKDQWGRAPLEVAREKGHAEVVAILEQKLLRWPASIP